MPPLLFQYNYLLLLNRLSCGYSLLYGVISIQLLVTIKHQWCLGNASMEIFQYNYLLLLNWTPNNPAGIKHQISIQLLVTIKLAAAVEGITGFELFQYNYLLLLNIRLLLACICKSWISIQLLVTIKRQERLANSAHQRFQYNYLLLLNAMWSGFSSSILYFNTTTCYY